MKTAIIFALAAAIVAATLAAPAAELNILAEPYRAFGTRSGYYVPYGLELDEAAQRKTPSVTEMENMKVTRAEPDFPGLYRGYGLGYRSLDQEEQDRE